MLIKFIVFIFIASVHEWLQFEWLKNNCFLSERIKNLRLVMGRCVVNWNKIPIEGEKVAAKPKFLNVHPGVYEYMLFIILDTHTNVINILNTDGRPLMRTWKRASLPDHWFI